MQKIQRQKNPALDTILCREAASFFDRVGKDGGSGVTNQTDTRRTGVFEAFSHQVVLALLSDYEHASAPEAGRKARVELGSVLARHPSLTSQDTRVKLGLIFDMWLPGERSRPLRDEIARAVDALTSTR